MNAASLIQLLSRHEPNTEVRVTAGWDHQSEGGGFHHFALRLDDCQLLDLHGRRILELTAYGEPPLPGSPVH